MSSNTYNFFSFSYFDFSLQLLTCNFTLILKRFCFGAGTLLHAIVDGFGYGCIHKELDGRTNNACFEFHRVNNFVMLHQANRKELVILSRWTSLKCRLMNLPLSRSKHNGLDALKNVWSLSIKCHFVFNMASIFIFNCFLIFKEVLLVRPGKFFFVSKIILLWENSFVKSTKIFC